MAIRYLVTSDLHLGAANSILTSLTTDNKKTLPNKASGVVTEYAKCLKVLAGDSHPMLILNGDVLELALAGTNEALMTFRRFIEELCEDGWPFADKVYYLPGNHDHHMWNVAREKQYRDNYLADTLFNEELKPEFQTTNMFDDEKLNPIPSDLLNLAVKTSAAADDVSFLTVYPNLALFKNNRLVVIHHGHYIESDYTLMTSLKNFFFPNGNDTDNIWELEAENGAWIDFFWSALGRSGQVGTDVELVYDKMQNKNALNAIIDGMSLSLVKMMPLKGKLGTAIKKRFVAPFLKHVADRVADKEVRHTEAPLSANAQKGLIKYMQEYLLNEITRVTPVPADTTFVFGHTHKPFESVQAFDGYPTPVKLFNSGGWVVDKPATSSLEGSAVIVIDDDLNVASVRLYNETDNRQTAAVSVKGENSPLLKSLNSLIDPTKNPWKTFSLVADSAVQNHRQNLLFHIAAQD
jgi:Calcineurin-like phosphoesterase